MGDEALLYHNVLDMCRARGYIIPAELRLNQEEFREKFYEEDGSLNRVKLTLSLLHQTEPGLTLRIFFYSNGNKPTGKADLERILEHMGDKRTRCIIILAPGSQFTSHARKMIDEMNTVDDVHIEYFMEMELIVPDFLHTASKVYKEEYRVLTKYERERIDARKFPIISLNDAVARYLGMKYQDVLRFTRSSESAGMYTKYQVAHYVDKF